MSKNTNIRKGDTVVVISGKDRAKTGKVLKSIPDLGRVVVDGVNLRRRRERARAAGKSGQVIESPAPLAVSKVMIVCSACGRGRRLGQRIANGQKIRVCRRCGKEV